METRANSPTDKILKGILHLCEKLLLFKKELRDIVGCKEKNNLTLEIFSKCLFQINNQENILPQNFDGSEE